MSKEHTLVVDTVRRRTQADRGLPPAITRFDALGRAARAVGDKHVAQQCLEDCCRTDHLVCFQVGETTWLTLPEPDHLRRTTVWLAEKDGDYRDEIGLLNTILLKVSGDD